MSQISRDPYKILGIPVFATKEEIKKAYRSMSSKWHPDVCNAPNAAEMFMNINWAYTELTKGNMATTEVKRTVEVWLHRSLFNLQKCVKEV